MQDSFTELHDIKNVLYSKDPLNSSHIKSSTFSTKTAETENYDKLFCKKCNKLFSTPGNLRNHIMTIHNNYRPFKCHFPNCTKKYAAESKLIAHERTHNGIRPFVCEICQKSFNEKGNLKTHLKFHSEIRPFKCPLCDKGYKSSGHLKDHIEIQHYKIKKFCCQFCNKTFGRTSTLKAHIRVHTKEKRFQCQFPGCGKRFTEKRNMENHYARHLKNLNQTVKNEKVKRTYGSKTIKKDFEEKIKIALGQLNNKNSEQKKIEEKKENENENKTDISSTEKNENLSSDFSDDTKYNDRDNLDNLRDISNFSNSFLNSKKSKNLNDMKEKDEEDYLKNEKINNNNCSNINNINNNNNNFICPNYNNLDLYNFHSFPNIDFINSDLFLKNDYLDLSLDNDLNEHNEDFIFPPQNDLF